jgi:hypothetical protein
LTDLWVGIVYEEPRVVDQAIRHLGFSELEAVGVMMAGAILLAVAANGSSTLPLTVILFWSQGLLVAGVALGIWIVVGRG